MDAVDPHTLCELQHGSYGQIYTCNSDSVVLKEPLEYKACVNYKHEYDVHVGIYGCFRPPAHICVVRPYMFTYARRTGRQLRFVKSASRGNTCFYTMERIAGSTDVATQHCLTANICQIPLESYTPYPPFMFMGAVELDGRFGPHVTLRRMYGSTFLYGYCVVEPQSVAHTFAHSMFAAFFGLIACGYMPRDIEFVFKCASSAAILDFNQVKTLAARRASSRNPSDYNQELDIAHAYIDLCGLRHTKDTGNPEYNEPPTPDWKFLPSPLTAPYLFFELCGTVENQTIVRHILDYVRAWYIQTGPPSRLDTWRPRQIAYAAVAPSDAAAVLGSYTVTEFAALYASWAVFTTAAVIALPPSTTRYVYYIPSHADTAPRYVSADPYLDLDIGLQYYFASTLLASRRMDEDVGASILPAMPYKDLMTYIQNLPSKEIPVETDMEFPSIWTGGSTQRRRGRTRRRSRATKSK